MSYKEIHTKTKKVVPEKKIINLGTPIQDRVLVEPALVEEKSAGGIIIPQTAQEKPQYGLIVAVGKNKDGSSLQVEVGDLVLYGIYAGIEIKIKGKDYLIMKEADLLLKLLKD